MSDYAEELLRRWELNDPRDRWRHTGEPRPGSSSNSLPEWKAPDELDRDIERMLVCDVCGADACFGFGVVLDGVRMGDVGSWRCTEHHPDRKAFQTREEWAKARDTERSRQLPIDMPQEFVD